MDAGLFEAAALLEVVTSEDLKTVFTPYLGNGTLAALYFSGKSFEVALKPDIEIRYQDWPPPPTFD